MMRVSIAVQVTPDNILPIRQEFEVHGWSTRSDSTFHNITHAINALEHIGHLIRQVRLARRMIQSANHHYQ